MKIGKGLFDIILVSILLFCVPVIASASSSTNYSITTGVISNGGNPGTSTTYALNGTVAESFVGDFSSTSYALHTGFWGTVSSNSAPTITGTATDQAVNDIATVSPFSSVTIADDDVADNVTATVTLDSSSKGLFTNSSLTTSGFSTADGGTSYTHASATPANMTTAIRELVYDPANNRVAPGSTETTTFSIAVNDGTDTTNSTNTTTVVSTSTNDSPTDITISSTSVNQSGGTNAVVSALSTTDVDTGESFTYIMVVGTGDTNNTSFNINSSNLRTNDASAMASGNYSVRIQSSDSSSATISKVFTITVVDDVAPAIPSTPDLIAASDSGSSDTDNNTSTPTPTFTGTAEADSTVTLTSSVDGAVGSVTADGAGVWSITASSLTAGAHNITATAKDAANNSSAPSVALSITIDTAAPVSPGIPDMTAGTDSGSSSTDNLTNDITPTFTGTAEVNSTVSLISSVDGTLGNITADGSGNWNITASALSEGNHNITATATDVAGNISAASTTLAIIIDITGPGAATGTLAVDENSTNGTAVGTVDSTDAVNYNLTADADSRFAINAGTGTVTVVNGALLDYETNVSHSITVQSTDNTGNSTATVMTVTVNDVNEIPTVNLDQDNSSGAGGNNFDTTFSAGSTAVACADVDAVLDDVDAGAQIASLTAILNTRPDGDTVENLALNATASAAATDAGLTVSYTDSSGVLLISGNAPLATYQVILRGIVYSNSFTVLTITTGNRTISVVASDGTGDSLTATCTINVVTAPMIDLGGDGGSSDLASTYTEGDGAKLMTSAATIIEPDGDNLNQLLIELTNAQDGANEGITLAGRINGDVVNGITITYTSATLITLSNNATTANYQALLQELEYSNNSENPTTTARTITVEGRDIGNNSGAVATLTLNITAVNDTPVIANNTGFTVLEGGSYSLTTVNLQFTDVDNTAMQLSYTVTTVPDGGQLEFTAAPGIGITAFTQEDIDTGKIVYTHNGDEGPTDTFSVNVSDGAGGSVTGTTISITVSPVDDAPTISGTPASSVNYGSSYEFVPIAADAEGDAMLFSIINRPTWATFNTLNGTLSGTPGSNDIGTTIGITITVTANARSTSLSTFDLTVLDNEAPVFNGVPEDILVITGSSSQKTVVVNWTEPKATDNVDGIVLPVQTGGLPNGSEFPVGITYITYIATDAQGNSSTESFTVTVVQDKFPWWSFWPGIMNATQENKGR